MKNKLFLYAVMYCIFVAPTCMAQTDNIAANGQSNVDIKTLNGVWVFDQAEFTAYRYGTDSPVETVRIDNVNSLDTAGFHFQTVFRKVEISGGQILVTLRTHRGDLLYQLEDNQLILVQEKEGDENKTAGDEELPTTIPLQAYVYAITGDKLQFTFKYSYGDSRFDFSLEGKLTVKLVLTI